ncbi:MAG: ABC transporter permease subunit [Angelakisella sp.]
MRDTVELLLLALPTTIWYLLFCYLPMFGVIVAFKKYRPKGENFIDSLMKSDWVGLKNFEFLFKTDQAWIMIRNTILYNVAFIILGTIIPVTLAIMMSNLFSQRFAKTCQTFMFLPHFMSWVVVSYFVFSFLSVDKGIMNAMLGFFGLPDVNWYMESKWWPFIIIFMRTWKTTGYSMVVYLASITSIDRTYYEAAVIDGASKWQQAKSITIPLLKPIIVIMFILAMGNIFSSDFGLFYKMTRGGSMISDTALTIDVYVYNALMGSTNIGMSAAAALFQSVFGCICIVASNLIVKKIDPDSGLF